MVFIRELTFSANEFWQPEPQPISIPNVFLLIGPNESGKSSAVNAVKRYYEGENNPFNNSSICGAKIVPPLQDELKNYFAEMLDYTKPTEEDDYLWLWHGTNGSGIQNSGRIEVSDLIDEQSYNQPNWRSAVLHRFLLAPKLEHCLNIFNEIEAGPIYPNQFPKNLYQLLIKEPKRLEKISRIIHAACGMYLSVEVTSSGKFGFILHTEPPASLVPGFVITPELSEYYLSGRRPHLFGSGLRAFIGLVILIFASEHKVILLDEPELHLHPPLIRLLARELVHETLARNANLIVSTHSADFVLGCVTSTSNLALARLRYSPTKQMTSVKAVPNLNVIPFANDTILRSTAALDGVFHESVVVVEGPLDQMVYSLTNEILHQEEEIPSIKDAKFLSAQGCNYVATVLNAVRNTGTPTVAIMDLDILLGNWNDVQLSKLGMDETDRGENLQLLSKFKSLVIEESQLGENYKVKALNQYLNESGLNNLTDNLKALGKTLLQNFEKYGVFVLSCGSLENLCELTFSIHQRGMAKDQFITEIVLKELEAKRMLSLNDRHGNLWGLISNIGKWLDDH